MKILVPLDGSDFAESVLDVGLQTYAPQQTHVVLLHTIDLNTLYARTGHEPADFYIQAERVYKSEKESYLQGVAKRLQDLGYSTSLRISVGDPVDTILQAAAEEEVDAIVMATHGRSGIERFFLGSVTEGVLRKSRWVVVVVPSARVGS